MPPSISACALAAAAALATGCFTGRAAVGPNLSTSGPAGVTATGGIGMGLSFSGHQAVYAVVNGGVVAADHARGQLFDAISYVNYDLPLPVRVDARLGILFGRKRFAEEQRPMFGAAIAVLPWYRKSRDSHYHSEKGWDDIGPDIDAQRGLGVEVAVDALPAPSAQEHGMTMVTVSLVGDIGTMLAP